MGFDEDLAGRVRGILSGRDDVEERRMFGGLAFMVRDHMSCGILGSSLMVRVGAEEGDRLLRGPHARVMDFTGRPMRGFLFVNPPGIATDRSLKAWVTRATTYAEALPPKKAKGSGRKGRRGGPKSRRKQG